MPKWQVCYDVRYYNGSIKVDAENRDEAEKKFNDIPIDELVEKSNSVSTDIEYIEMLKE